MDEVSDQLVSAFESGRIDGASFHHRDHVRLTWALLGRMSAEAALDRLRSGLMQLAAANGKPGRYHETITAFYVSVIHRRMSSSPSASFDEFVDRNADITGSPRAFLLRHYRAETIDSEAARRAFASPDFE